MRIVKTVFFLLCLLQVPFIFAQKRTPLPHGMVYGEKPSVIAPGDAKNLETYLGKKTRATTAVFGKVIRITKPKGGWFEMDAGNGKIIAAHFKDYNVTLPAALKGRTVIIEGVAQRMFIADDRQHFAGDTVNRKKQHEVKTNPKQRITFEVKGLMVDI